MLKLWPFYFFIFSLEAAEWNFKNNPFFKASKILETNLDSLPQSFEISGLFGSDWIWPVKEGGIINRWALKNPKKTSDKYLFSFYPYESLKNVDLAQLSPTEKFDLYLGNFDWNFSKLVKKAQATLRETDFKTQLAFSESVLNFKNPSPLIVEGKNSLKIPFGSSDISALLFASLLLDEKSETKIIGSPCQITFNQEFDSEKCDGVNPGTFHVLITNYLGLRDKGLIMDLKRDKNLELRPIIGFVSNFKTIEGVPPGNSKIKKEVLVSTFVKFIRPVLPKWSFEPTTSSRGYESYTYILELDERNNIKGGKWISFNRPDFIAIKNSIPFQDYFKQLETIYRNSTSLVFESDLKFKGFSQKEILMESISKSKTSEIINSMFEEYFENYKNQLKQKKLVKKFARARLSREINLNQKYLLQKIKLIPVGPTFKKLSLKFIQLAESGANPKDIKQIQKSFIDLARRNFSHPDLFNMGKIGYLQQKYLDDFIDKSNLDYNRFDLLERSFLLESNIFNEKEILTANKSFLDGSLTFLKGARKQRDDLKSNATGQLKANNIIPKIKDVKNSPLVSSFISDLKTEVQRSKIRENKNWKKFLSEEKSISRNNLPIPNLQEEFKKYKTPRNYLGLKKLYRLSFSLKRIQAWKKVLKIPVYNTLKDKTDYYQQKFLFESGQAKESDFFMPYSKFEGIGLCAASCFKGPILNKESENFLNFFRIEVGNYDKNGSQMIAAIKKKDLKGVEELSQNSFSAYETSDRQNILTYATLEGNNEIIKLLLATELGDAINFEDKNGKNALTLGITKNVDQEVLKLMVVKGIDFNARDNLGFYPRDYLKRTNSFDQYLEGLGAKLSKVP